MAIRTVVWGGVDFLSGEDLVASDFNDTFNKIYSDSLKFKEE